jgi:hypothetical protein
MVKSDKLRQMCSRLKIELRMAVTQLKRKLPCTFQSIRLQRTAMDKRTWGGGHRSERRSKTAMRVRGERSRSRAEERRPMEGSRAGDGQKIEESSGALDGKEQHMDENR